MSTEPSQIYVAGFLFRNSSEVALIRKNKPDWQKGFWNGIGGKVEPGETAYQAMRREFREEAGADINTWREFCCLTCSDGKARIHFFTAAEENPQVQALTDEIIGWFGVDQILGNQLSVAKVIPNLRWLIPLALDPQMTHCEAVR